ncbi:hypothetical protein K501DRAFT_211388 [Backusella circina FSU 941]|nr:hypothetical protein K501DRAFT_211388 [Backusella circina FSU 941]
MQQQQISERKATFALLNRAEKLTNNWSQLQSKSLSILYNISNLVSQRMASMECSSLLEANHVQQNRLIYKQTQAIEDNISKLDAILDLFSQVVNDWEQLDTEAARHITKSRLDLPTTPLPISTESLIHVTRVHPTEARDMIANLLYMYKQEYRQKRELRILLPKQISDHDQFASLVSKWEKEACIDFQVELDMFERIQLYKQVKKVLESVD